jgi:hypothetical protein
VADCAQVVGARAGGDQVGSVVDDALVDFVPTTGN